MGVEGLGPAAVWLAQRVKTNDVAGERLERCLGWVSALVHQGGRCWGHPVCLFLLLLRHGDAFFHLQASAPIHNAGESRGFISRTCAT